VVAPSTQTTSTSGFAGDQQGELFSEPQQHSPKLLKRDRKYRFWAWTVLDGHCACNPGAHDAHRNTQAYAGVGL